MICISMFCSHCILSLVPLCMNWWCSICIYSPDKFLVRTCYWIISKEFETYLSELWSRVSTLYIWYLPNMACPHGCVTCVYIAANVYRKEILPFTWSSAQQLFISSLLAQSAGFLHRWKSQNDLQSLKAYHYICSFSLKWNTFLDKGQSRECPHAVV